jgi:hypothetical protein
MSELTLSILVSPTRYTKQLSTFPFMSHPHPVVSSSSNFQLIFNDALDKYNKCTKHDLRGLPLAAQLQSCTSPSAIITVLQQQFQDQSRTSDDRWSRWLDPTVNVLYALSSTLGAGVGLVRPKIRICLRSALSYLSDRCSHRRMRYLLGSVPSFQCVSFLVASFGSS